ITKIVQSIFTLLLASLRTGAAECHTMLAVKPANVFKARQGKSLYARFCIRSHEVHWRRNYYAANIPSKARIKKRRLQPGGKTRSALNGRSPAELVVITGMSGSGKASVLKAFEDLGYYCVDNLPVGLIPRFAELVGQSAEISRTALVVDVREGAQLESLP